MNYLKTNNSKKMVTTILVIFISLILLCGCGIEKVQEETRLCKEAKKEGIQFFEYLKEEDASSLSSLFSEEVVSDYNLEEEWKTFFEQINSKIIDYETIDVFESQRTFSDDNLSYLLLRIEFKNVKTDSGQIYKKIRYSKTARCISDSDKEGVNWVELIIDGDQKSIILPVEEE